MPSLKSLQVKSRFWLVCRAFVAAIVLLSFLALIIPLGAATAGRSGLMACCIGKPGHESGSCSTGLLEAAQHPQPQPDLSPVPQEAPPKTVTSKFAKVSGGAGAGEHCALHVDSTSEITENQNEPSEPESSPKPARLLIASSSETEESSAETEETAADSVPARREPRKPGSMSAFSTPCPMECGACSVSNIRRPRPRDQSTLTFLPKPQLPLGRRFSRGAGQQIRVLTAKYSQLHPRAPPASNLS